MVAIFSRVKEIIKYGVMYGCITHCTFEYVGDFVVCNGPSMEPTLQSKNILVTERITTRFNKPRRGDIIVAVSPADPKQFICKRIVGIPGDRIITKVPTVISNLDDKASTKQIEDDIVEYVPRGYVWIEGDNSENSSDSRYYGPIPLGLVKSRVVCRLWPISEIRLF